MTDQIYFASCLIHVEYAKKSILEKWLCSLTSRKKWAEAYTLLPFKSK